MLHLFNGIYIDKEDGMILRLEGDNKRPSVLYNPATDSDTSAVEKETGVKVSVS